MVQRTRNLSRGNERMDYTKVRERLKELPPVLQATLRNAVAEDRTMASDTSGDKKHIDPHRLEKLSNIISNNINAAEDLRGITPYIDKAELLWNALLFHPNGFQERILTRDTQPSRIKSDALHAQLLPIWDDYFTNDYKIEAELPKYASDILWNTGSYCLFNLSRPGLDYLINGSEKRPGADASERSGNEAYLIKAREALNVEFTEVDGKRRMRNKGVFVRDPNQTESSRVSGLESLLGGTKEYSGNEFRLFKTDDDDKSLFDITMTDNPAILYLQRFNKAARAQEIDRVTGVESLDLIISSSLKRSERALKDSEKETKPSTPDAKTLNITTTEMQGIHRELYPHRNPVHQSLQYVKTNDSLSVAPYGQGLTFHIPSEAVLTVHLNGNSGAVRDYIFLLDDEGGFLKNTGDFEFYQSKKTKGSIRDKPKMGDVNNLVANLKTVASGSECDFDMTEFIDVARNNLLRQITSAVVSDKGESISITMDEETNKIWLGRMFRKQGVRCLYVPGEAVTYMAFKFNRLGVGQSLTQAAKVHIARLAAYDVADALANIAGATPHTQLEVDIPKETADPEHMVAIVRQTFFDVNPRLHSLLSTAQLSVPQIVDAIRESSLTMKINASENPHMPTPNFNMTALDKEIFKPVDQASRDGVLNTISNYFHVPRSWMDITDDQNNFKIEAVNEHDMVLNQRTMWANQLTGFVMDFERKHVRVNAIIMEKLVDAIRNNEKLWKPDSKEELPGTTKEENIKFILVDFINNIYSTLPTPSSSEKTTQVTDGLNAVKLLVDAWEEMSASDMVMEQIIKLFGFQKEDYSFEEIKKSIRGVLIADAFKRFNLPMPFDEIVNDGKGGGIASLVHQVVHQRNNVGEFLVQYITEVTESDGKLIKTYKDKLDKKIEKLSELQGQGADQDQNAGGDGLDGDVTGDDNSGVDDSTGTPGSDDFDPFSGSTDESEGGAPEEGGETPDEGTDEPPAEAGTDGAETPDADVTAGTEGEEGAAPAKAGKEPAEPATEEEKPAEGEEEDTPAEGEEPKPDEPKRKGKPKPGDPDYSPF
jgi:hypothetical protein